MHEDISQIVLSNPSIFQSFIHARPVALKPQRLRDFWQRFGLRFRHQGIYRVEQGIFGPQETAINIVTKLSQYVNVHLSKIPFWFDDWNFTQLGHPPRGWGPFVSFSLNANTY